MNDFTPGVVLCTCPDKDTARRLAALLVDESLAACVNILPGVTSVYRWEGRVETDSELLLVIKTSRERWDQLNVLLAAEHPYDVPEIVFLPLSHGLPAYLEWMRESLDQG